MECVLGIVKTKEVLYSIKKDKKIERVSSKVDVLVETVEWTTGSKPPTVASRLYFFFFYRFFFFC